MWWCKFIITIQSLHEILLLLNVKLTTISCKADFFAEIMPIITEDWGIKSSWDQRV